MGKGLQPLVAMETHVSPSLCLSASRTDRQPAASQPRITYSEVLVRELWSQELNKHTPDTAARKPSHNPNTNLHKHVVSDEEKTKSLS